MAREHPTEKKETPQVLEREINLSLINAKLNELMGLVLGIAKKQGIETEED